MHRWLAVIVLLLAGFGICYSTDPDKPVSSSGQTGQRSIMEGVQGRVTDTRERPVVGALLTPKSLDAPSRAIPEIAIVSDDKGDYAWRLSPGQYTLTVSADGYIRTEQRVTVTANQTTTVNFRLDPTR